MSLYELFIGFRYLKSKKKQGFISFNTFLSIFIVFLGVFILIVVISVLNGFQSQIKDKILDVDSHITVLRNNYEIHGHGISDYHTLVKKIKSLKGVKSAHPFIQGSGLFRLRTNINYVMIRGIGKKDGLPLDVRKFIVDKKGRKLYDKKGNIIIHKEKKRITYKHFSSETFFNVNKKQKQTKNVPSIVKGKPVSYPNGVYIGHEMAKTFGLSIGDNVELIVPKGRLTVVTGVTPGIGVFRIQGFFKTGYYDFDTKLIVMSLPQAQRLYEIGNTVWGISIKVNDVYQMTSISRELYLTLGANYVTLTAEEKNQNLFYALKLERLIMTIILFLVIIAAGFSIMGTIVMVVMEKRKAIGILKAMGAKLRSIMIIFVLEGFFIGVIGTFLGVIVGLVAALNLEHIIRSVELFLNIIMSWVYTTFQLGVFNRISIVPTHVYYIDAIPTEVNPQFVVFISIFAVFLATVASIFPAWQASRLNPVETIRYE